MKLPPLDKRWPVFHLTPEQENLVDALPDLLAALEYLVRFEVHIGQQARVGVHMARAALLKAGCTE